MNTTVSIDCLANALNLLQYGIATLNVVKMSLDNDGCDRNVYRFPAWRYGAAARRGKPPKRNREKAGDRGMRNNDSRKAFMDFCDTVRNTEKDKDLFLAAAHLQRTEKASAFTAGQMIGLAVMMAMVLLGSVAIVCLTLTGKTGCILPALGGTLLATFFAGAMAIAGN